MGISVHSDQIYDTEKEPISIDEIFHKQMKYTAMMKSEHVFSRDNLDSSDNTENKDNIKTDDLV